LKAVIFDCDGVLVDSEWLASRVESELLRELGMELTVEQVHELFLGKTVGGVLDIIAARRGAPLPPEFTYDWAFATARAFVRELQPIPFVHGVLERLHDAGHRLAVASQSPLARVRLSLEVTGLAPFFGEHLYVTTMVARPKPAPDVYLLAASRLGAAPADCLVIEDSPAGAAAARGAGMQALGYAPGDTVVGMRTAGVPVLRSMDELPGYIAALH
jgi:HAD superfamily hydrolase (TIGR01509 family)